MKQDPIKLEEMLLHSEDVRKVPVIVEGEKVSIGLWRTLRGLIPMFIKKIEAMKLPNK